MSQLEQFERLSLHPYSSASLPLIEAALRRITARYPNRVQCAGGPDYVRPISSQSVGWHIPPTDSEWLHYASRMADMGSTNSSIAIPDSAISSLARGEPVDSAIIQAYLELLSRGPNTGTGIQEIRYLQERNDLGDEGLSCPMIIPFQKGTDWAFAAVYSDCVHWYDSRHGSNPPVLLAQGRPIASEWTGPKEARGVTKDSGIFTLLGIRCIYHGAPHLSQEAADALVPSFRARLLVELLCQKLNPTPDDFQSLLATEQPISTHFEEAMYGMDHPSAGPFRDLSPSPPNLTYPSFSNDNTLAFGGITSTPAAYDGPTPGVYDDFIPAAHDTTPPPLDDPINTLSPQEERWATPLADASAMSTDRHGDADGPHVTLDRVAQPLAAERRVELAAVNISDDFNTMLQSVGDSRSVILNNLSDAILVHRSIHTSQETDLAVIWEWVRNSAMSIKGSFHVRYNAALFHSRMNKLNDRSLFATMKCPQDQVRKMREKQKECQLWSDICDMGAERWGPDGKFVMLTAVPSGMATHRMNISQRETLKEVLRLRLDNDQFVSWLQQAVGLCRAIIENKITHPNLMIDQFRRSHFATLTDEKELDEEFKVYTSTDRWGGKRRLARLPGPNHSHRGV